MVDEADTISESEKRLQTIVDYAREKQQLSGVELLWGTANLFSNPKYMNGAATNPDIEVVAHAGAQVKRALDATIALVGSIYVSLGGREDHTALLNTDVERERDHMARFLHVASDYVRVSGVEGRFLIEPKRMELMMHEYDFDAATVIGFMREYGLEM